MRLVFHMSLPRDASSVPVVRHICRDALNALGVQQSCVEDIELAVTEACTNVLRHAGDSGEGYDVDLEIDRSVSTIRITDTGSGLTAAAPMSLTEPQESGRGIHLMSALVDVLRLSSRPQGGTEVHLEKGLSFTDESVLQQLSSAT